jgi:hypothetical protein
MPNSPRRLVRLLLAAIALVALSAGIAACGYENESTDVVEGEPVELGDLQYNVIFSRYLNPNDNEDSAYLVGQAPAPKDSAYFGVFLEVQNENEESKPLPAEFTVEDADKQVYRSLASESLYAFPLGGEVESHEQVPILDSTPQQGPIEGSLVLFLIPETASENRPLLLQIPSPGGEEGVVTLDL